MTDKLNTPEAPEELIDEILIKLSADLERIHAEADVSKTDDDSEGARLVTTPSPLEQYFYHFITKNPQFLEFLKSNPTAVIRQKLSDLGLENGILSSVINITKSAIDSTSKSPIAHTSYSSRRTGVMVINHQKIAELLR